MNVMEFFEFCRMRKKLDILRQTPNKQTNHGMQILLRVKIRKITAIVKAKLKYKLSIRLRIFVFVSRKT